MIVTPLTESASATDGDANRETVARGRAVPACARAETRAPRVAAVSTVDSLVRGAMASERQLKP